MKTLAAAVFLASAPAQAQETARIEGKNLKAEMPVSGGVRPLDIFRLRSTTGGRLDAWLKKPNSWAKPKEPLARLLTAEQAALLDSRSPVASRGLDETMDKYYAASPLICRKDCFVLKLFAMEKQLVETNALLAEAAGKMVLFGSASGINARRLNPGQDAVYWPKKNPALKASGKVETVRRDEENPELADFTIVLPPNSPFDPSTEWEGQITIAVKKNVPSVPTEALIRRGGEIYLPVRVDVGVSADGWTEILSGADRGQGILLLKSGDAFQPSSSEPSPVTRKTAPPPENEPEHPQILGEDEEAADDDAARPRRKRRSRRRPSPSGIRIFSEDDSHEVERFPSDEQ